MIFVNKKGFIRQLPLFKWVEKKEQKSHEKKKLSLFFTPRAKNLITLMRWSGLVKAEQPIKNGLACFKKQDHRLKIE